MDTKLAAKLSVLAESTLVTVMERNRCRSMNIPFDSHDETISRNTKQLREGIHTLEAQLSEAESSGGNAKDLEEMETTLINLTQQVEKVEALAQDRNDATARELLLGKPPKSTKRTVHFADQVVEPDDLESGQLLQLQQRIMEDQDENLEHLSSAVGRQRELGLLIGDELDTHMELLDDVDSAVDGTDSRLKRAKRRLAEVGKQASKNWGCYTIAILSLILFLLIVVL
ncbi:uncharacterized protein VTP21DRAFT_4545 [Calcarisporiella thermophila]|uniref:uncharacterized protein n=1 Tax=Calcarisporiella thermophila TaxID=911321 RepID=UPI0037425CA6